MTYFLTSSPFAPDAPVLSNENGFLERLRAALPGPAAGLFICSDPDRYDFTDRIAEDMRFALTDAGVSFTDYAVLDGRNAEQAPAPVRRAGLIVLAGGHVPTQNAFFRRIGLRGLLRGWTGVLIGISAGTMNCADTVYAQPEEPGEALSRDYRRFLPGLGVTQTMLLPHYQKEKDTMLDGMRLYEDITYPDSLGRCFYAMPDGSYLLGRNGEEALYGEAWRIADGVIRKVAERGGVLPLHRE